MAGVNKVILVGNLGQDPEVRTLENGTKLAKLRLATTENYTNRNGERVSNTEWHTIIVWRGLADIAEKYLKKGRQLYVEGRLRTRSYEDQDNNTKYVTEIVGDNFQMLGQRENEGNGGSYQPDERPARAQEAKSKTDFSPDSGEEMDDLPF